MLSEWYHIISLFSISLCFDAQQKAAVQVKTCIVKLHKLAPVRLTPGLAMTSGSFQAEVRV